ncbi:MAG: efflux RND transporter periplasmic adaptor subunit [Rhizobacter sp.]|nr:efflux RND transporter periplasmic adaptor subunit [Rhizobacter sp.]
MKSRSNLALLALAALVAGGSAWWFTRVPVVPATTVGNAPLVRTLQFSARVATRSRVDVGSTLTGRVVQVAVAEGAQVKRGDPLVQLESDELRAALAQAKAGERQAAARLAGLRGSGRSVAQAAVAQTESVLAEAQADLRRTQELVAQGFLSAARLDDARRAVGVARAQQAGSLAQRSAVAEQGTDVAQAEAQLALARSATTAAEARLAQATVTAPADATVLARQVEPGQIVQPGRALLSLSLAGPLQLVAQVDERYLEQMRVGQSASVLADAFPERRFGARVLTISPLVDAQRGAIEVKFELAQEVPAFLREDMTLSVELETARRERALTIPASALRGGPTAGKARVLIERDGRVEQRDVRLGLRTLEAAEVLEGLAEGDVVLVGPPLSAGSRVRADTSSPLPSSARQGTREDAGSAVMNAMGR